MQLFIFLSSFCFLIIYLLKRKIIAITREITVLFTNCWNGYGTVFTHLNILIFETGLKKVYDNVMASKCNNLDYFTHFNDISTPGCEVAQRILPNSHHTLGTEPRFFQSPRLLAVVQPDLISRQVINVCRCLFVSHQFLFVSQQIVELRKTLQFCSSQFSAFQFYWVSRSILAG